ncbi:MAG: DUF169 domain-containing protein [Candidatus Saccharicenans sp.]|nr:MAG: hypothetical protein C0168_01955 [Candidatus Aminicenantes bacterium]HEK85843.1 hypothetical protein [Candidatus Aminicenantes bacterium]
MFAECQKKFMEKWPEYFPQARWPVAFFYSADEAYSSLLAPPPVPGKGGSVNCLIKQVSQVFDQVDIAFSAERIGCSGGKRYTGFSEEIQPNFRWFLSCGLEGVMEGERYKKNPEIVDLILQKTKFLEASAPYLIFRRFDRLKAGEIPEGIIFLDQPDVISALFTLGEFREVEGGVICPFASGCASLVYYPRLEAQKENPSAVLGLFDISARPFVEPNHFSITLPLKKFIEMVEDLDESFLTTASWARIKARLNSGK